MEDKEAIVKIKNGEIDAFSFIVRNYTSRIHNYISMKLFDKLETDDLVQNVFLSFYKAIPRFEISKPILPYLFQITKNELKMYYRAKKQTVSLNEDIKVIDEKEIFSEADYQDILRVLPKNEKKIFQWIYEGYSYEEIAKKINKPTNTIKTLVRRARLKLSKKTYEKT